MNQFIAAHPLSVIACIKDSSTNSFQSAFEHTAEEMYLRSDIAFGWGHSSSVVGSSQCPSLVMRRPGTEAPEEYDPSTSKALQQELAAWVARRAVEPVGEIDSGTIDQYMAIDLPLAWVITPGKIDPALLASLKPVAAEFAEEVALVWMNDEAHPGQTRHLGVNHRGLPTLVITADTRRYILTPRSTEFSADTVRAFIKDFLADKLTPHVRSQEAPSEAENARRAVKVAVGMNFEALVRDTAKDVIVNFYAPWCGHCQALAPVYEQAAKLLAPVQTVVFAEMDATENDLPRDVAVTGYPTLYLFPAAATGAKEKEKDEVVVGEAVPMPVRYTGDRSVAGIVRFIQENAATKFALPEDLREFVEQEESFVAARIAEMNRESEEAKAAVEGRNEAEEKKEKKKKEEEDKSAEVKKAEEKVEETSTVTETTKEEL